MRLVTPMQFLRRAGLDEVATAIERHLKEKPNQLNQLSLNSLLTLTTSKYDSIGVSDNNAKSLKAFVEWWSNTPPANRRKNLAFLNYFDSPYDQRSIEKCVHDSESILVSYFLKAFPNNKARVTSAIKNLVLSKYPHSEQQVIHFLKKYSGKPSLAQDKISELIDVPTLHSEDCEGQVLGIYLLAANRLQLLFKNYKIMSLADTVSRAIDSAKAISHQQENW